MLRMLPGLYVRAHAGFLEPSSGFGGEIYINQQIPT